MDGESAGAQHGWSRSRAPGAPLRGGCPAVIYYSASGARGKKKCRGSTNLSGKHVRKGRTTSLANLGKTDRIGCATRNRPFAAFGFFLVPAQSLCAKG